LVILLIAVNGFFAGAEVSLISVRPSRLRQMAEEGQAGAQAALNLLARPGRLLSMTQVGVTLASLGLGWAIPSPRPSARNFCTPAAWRFPFW
jgi:CBS domain containing-hemolysin-like protein